MNYTNRMKCLICLEWYVKDVNLETFNRKMLQKLKFWHSSRNGECIEWVDGYDISSDGTGYMKPSNTIIVTGWNGKWLTTVLIVINYYYSRHSSWKERENLIKSEILESLIWEKRNKLILIIRLTKHCM